MDELQNQSQWKMHNQSISVYTSPHNRRISKSSGKGYPNYERGNDQYGNTEHFHSSQMNEKQTNRSNNERLNRGIECQNPNYTNEDAQTFSFGVHRSRRGLRKGWGATLIGRNIPQIYSSIRGQRTPPSSSSNNRFGGIG